MNAGEIISLENGKEYIIFSKIDFSSIFLIGFVK